MRRRSKEILLDESRYRYDPFHYLLTTVDLPYAGQVLEASKARPYLSLRLELAPTLVSSVMVEAGHAQPRDRMDVRAIAVSPLDGNLLDAVVRLTRLLDAPAEVPVLLPLLTREMIYRLLVGEQGARLRYLAVLSGYTPHIARAIAQLRRDFDQPLHIESLARELGMSVSGLHHHAEGRHGAEPLAIPEATAAPRGPPFNAGRRPRSERSGLPRGLPRRLPLQSRVQKPDRASHPCATCNGCGKGRRIVLADEHDEKRSPD